RRHDVEIVFSDETNELLDTGGGVVKAMPTLGAAPFFVVNSDSIWIEHGTPALTAMTTQLDENRMDALLLLADIPTAIGYDGNGDFVLQDDGRLVRARTHAGAAYGYLGVQIIHPRLFADAPQGAFSTNVMWDRAIAAGRLWGTVLDGKWIHVGTPQARVEAEAALAAQPAA
ncbi:MAG TPA: hypothetical protein VII41_14860, partial [Steroidobacteraceae bacterium]